MRGRFIAPKVSIAVPKLGLDRGKKKKARKPQVDHETPIHEAIYQFLKVVLLPYSMVHHSPNELGVSLKPEHRKIVLSKQKRKGVQAGWPDLEALAVQHDGTYIFFVVEVKSDTGELSPEQKRLRDNFKRIGVKYCVARSIKDVEEFLIWEEIDNLMSKQKMRKGP